MLLKLNKYSYLIFAICFFTAAAIIENNLLKQHPEIHLIDDFQDQLVINEEKLATQIEKISEIITNNNFDGSFFEALKNYTTLINESGTGFLVYKSGNLVYWSDRSVSFYGSLRDFKKREGLLQLPNGYYLASNKIAGDFEIVGLNLIRHNYEHENKYLKNSFFKTYNLPDDYILLDSDQKGAFKVLNYKGKYVFSIKTAGQFLCTQNQLYFPGIIYFLGLIILLYYFRKEFLSTEAAFFLRLFGLAAALFIVFWLHLMFKIPGLLLHLPFFSPEVFAINIWLPSLGDFFLMVLFFVFWLYNFTDCLNLDKLNEDGMLPRQIIATLLLLFAASLFLLVNYFIEILIYNSTISFSLNKIIGITIQSIVGIFSVGLLLFGIIYLVIKIIDEAADDFSFFQLTSIILAIAVFLGLVQCIDVQRVS
jgi:hypothetical protein